MKKHSFKGIWIRVTQFRAKTRTKKLVDFKFAINSQNVRKFKDSITIIDSKILKKYIFDKIQIILSIGNCMKKHSFKGFWIRLTQFRAKTRTKKIVDFKFASFGHFLQDFH